MLADVNCLLADFDLGEVDEMPRVHTVYERRNSTFLNATARENLSRALAADFALRDEISRLSRCPRPG